jgi:hypothetical protein
MPQTAPDQASAAGAGLPASPGRAVRTGRDLEGGIPARRSDANRLSTMVG